MPERRYAMVRVATSDYLLPSNDREVLWRIATYVDGPSSGLDWPKDLTLWALWKLIGPIPAGVNEFENIIEDWDSWDFWEGGLKTRKEAIAAAMTADERRRAQ